MENSYRQSLLPSFLYSSTSSFSSLTPKTLDVPETTYVLPPANNNFLIPAPTEPGKIEMYSSQFYVACTFGGILSCGLTHMVVTPLDLVKCNMHLVLRENQIVNTNSLRSVGFDCMGSRRNDFDDGASPGKIFIGGLAKETTLDSVIMKDRHTGRPRGFGFITYVDPSVVDTVIAETHNINDKQVEIKRTIPKGSAESKNFRTKKVFVGGIPTTMDEDEFKGFFSKYGKVIDYKIIRDHVSKRSRCFGFIEYDEEQVVDNLLSQGNMIDMLGNHVEIKKVEPKKPSHPASGPAYGSESRGRAYNDSYDGGFGDSYNNFGSGGGFGSASYRSSGGLVTMDMVVVNLVAIEEIPYWVS
ncbi:hypothetical protein H5410_059660 [Solanum commersonii]|uniref:RRM domain-containing protein n=1 Tax=Solanum commersonii TaxID=4109 RepID=A0A9J5W451_SOLCO|nr:hypothetical protein H5410_059660 [Solanum commersonii]